MSRRPYIIILIVLLVAVAAVLGFMYFREKPQVSKDETQVMLEGYKAGLEEAYGVLNDTYGQLAADKNTAEWQKFSSEWIPGLSEIRPADIDKRLPSEYEGKKNLLLSTHGALISLWTEYNRDFTGDVTDQERVKEMKTGIEDVFKNLEI
jgi:hypothetical protein